MTFSELKKFLSKDMRLANIYQPVMLLSLLERRGTCHEQDIASVILSYDLSQLDYYTKITNDMVGKVLRNRNIVEKNGKNYSLNGFDKLTPLEIEKLKLLCQTKLIEFIESRGESIWSHRKKASGCISGTIRYEVLKRSKFHCELCGISAQEKALEVDHIIPINCCGSDELSNFQALCYSCNAMKGDRDDTDLRAIRESYDIRQTNCLFCGTKKERIVSDNELAYVILDKFPVTELHTLIIPKRHVASYFELGQAEINAVNQLISEQKNRIIVKDTNVTGFNIGVNCGEDAGQTVFHCHIHLIPRRKGDVKKPMGGVRHTIPGKGYYNT